MRRRAGIGDSEPLIDGALDGIEGDHALLADLGLETALKLDQSRGQPLDGQFGLERRDAEHPEALREGAAFVRIRLDQALLGLFAEFGRVEGAAEFGLRWRFVDHGTSSVARLARDP